jgi:hypothetical protein
VSTTSSSSYKGQPTKNPAALDFFLFWNGLKKVVVFEGFPFEMQRH